MSELSTATRYAPTGMVAPVDHLASSAGVAVLREGGSAVDAAVATSAVLAVTCPHLCGMGGDLFALVHVPGEGEPAALNASGRAGGGADPARLLAEGATEMPFRGDLRSAPVPGCVDGWLALHERFGRLPLDDVLAAAITYAAAGFPASPLLATAQFLLDGVAGADDLCGPRPLRAGDVVFRPGVARASSAIATSGRAGFYEGEFGEGLLAIGAGEYRNDDLLQPLAELGGAGAGGLGPRRLDDPAELAGVPDPARRGHRRGPGPAERSRRRRMGPPARRGGSAAGHDRPAVLHEGADVSALFAPDEIRAAARAHRPRPPQRVGPGGDGGRRDHAHVRGRRRRHGRVAHPVERQRLRQPRLRASHRDRPAQPGHRLQPRPGSSGVLRPGRRPPHTLSPALVSRPDGSLRAVVGTMGGDSQPQILLQVLSRSSTTARRPAPRWAHPGGRSRAARGSTRGPVPTGSGCRSSTTPPRVGDGLERRGHRAVVAGPEGAHGFGHAHLIAATEAGWAAASDPRAPSRRGRRVLIAGTGGGYGPPGPQPPHILSRGGRRWCARRLR